MGLLSSHSRHQRQRNLKRILQHPLQRSLLSPSGPRCHLSPSGLPRLPSIAQLVFTQVGRLSRRIGAASIIIFAVRSQRRHRPQTLTIAPMALRTGWWAGRLARRSGAAACTAKVVQVRATSAAPQLAPQAHPMIATPVSPTGWPAGALPRRTGVAGTLARVARQQLEDAREQALSRL